LDVLEIHSDLAGVGAAHPDLDLYPGVGGAGGEFGHIPLGQIHERQVIGVLYRLYLKILRGFQEQKSVHRLRQPRLPRHPDRPRI
jgi:hypothetical protein